MTEQEAIKRLEFLNEALNFQRADADESSCALQMAIKSLEEISLYKQDRLSLIPSDTFEILYEELEQYRALGTVEELRVARDKQVAKKVIDISRVRDCDGYIGLIGKCPCCGEIQEDDVIYCDCGQKLDWSDEDDNH